MEAGILRADYPGYSGEETVEQITWQGFFRGFEENPLAFLYEDETKAGEERRFSKLIDPTQPKAGVLHTHNIAVKQIGDIEGALGLADLAQFTAPPPPKDTRSA